VLRSIFRATAPSRIVGIWPPRQRACTKVPQDGCPTSVRPSVAGCWHFATSVFRRTLALCASFVDPNKLAVGEIYLTRSSYPLKSKVLA
jgi:hypothetical protein